MKTYDIRAETVAEQPTAVAEATLSMSEIGPWLERTYDAIARLLTEQGTSPAGPPFATYRLVDAGRFRVRAGFPVSAPIAAGDEVQPATLPGGTVAVTVHVGPYEDIAPAYQALAGWVHEQGAQLAEDAWEIYHSDPAAEPDPAKWRTEVVQPYRPG